MNNFQDNIGIFRRGFYDTPGTEEPTFLTFSIDFNYYSILDSNLGIMSSPLFDVNTKNGAYQYLIARGYNYQADSLLRFLNKIRDISENHPWFFQSISGLDTLWSAYTDMTKPFKGKDKTINIDTLESLDLSITYLADMYRRAMYDSKYMREIVPENLRRFQVDIYIAEFRNLKMDDTDSDYSFFEKYKTHVHYKCSMCEFDFSKSLPIKDNLTVFKPEMASNKFSIKPIRFEEVNMYDLQSDNNDNNIFNSNRHAVNLNEKNDNIKISLGDILNGARRLSDVYHGIESGEYWNNLKTNNPISAAVSNVVNEVDFTADYIKSNIKPNNTSSNTQGIEGEKPMNQQSHTQQQISSNGVSPVTSIPSSIVEKQTVALNAFDKVISNNLIVDTKLYNIDDEKIFIPKLIDTTIKNADIEKTIINTPIDNTVKNIDNEKTFIPQIIDISLKNPDTEKTQTIKPIDHTIYNEDNEKTQIVKPIDHTVYNKDNEIIEIIKPIDHTIYNKDNEKHFSNQPIDKNVYNEDPINTMVTNKYIKPKHALNPFDKNKDVI